MGVTKKRVFIVRSVKDSVAERLANSMIFWNRIRTTKKVDRPRNSNRSVHVSAARARAALILGISALCFGNVRWSETKIPGDTFKPIQADLESELRTLRASDLGSERGFNADDVNSILTNTSAKIIKQVPPDDAPLIYYIKAKTPKPVDNERIFVARPEAESKFAVLQDLLRKLTSLPAFQMDLTINTTPPKAIFELVPPVGSSLSAATNATLTNVYRGEYKYKVTKSGYKPVERTINFIDLSGHVLECELISESIPQEALPCNLN